VAGSGTCDDVESLCEFHIITPDLVSSPLLEGSTPFNEYKERLLERCLQRIGYGSGHRFFYLTQIRL
jgi:hypothetical protein